MLRREFVAPPIPGWQVALVSIGVAFGCVGLLAALALLRRTIG
jgi:hypothetical protein